jgi:uncharacterized protein YkwD
MVKMAVPTALLVGAVAVAGCGGGGSSNSAKPPTPVQKTKPSGSGTVVSAQGTLGLVGPADRSTSKGSQVDQTKSPISPSANHKTKAQQHGVASGAACDNGDITPSADNQSDVNAAILCLVNGERADAGLPALTENQDLDQAATGMANQMVAEHFFDHVTPEGKNVVDRVQPTGYIPNSGDWVVGENLAWGSGALATPQAIVNGWMNSPGHKANILAPDYKDVGLAISFGTVQPGQSGSGVTYVNDFGAKDGADLNAKLPSENGSSDSSSSGTTSSGANSASVVIAGHTTHKARKAKRKHRRHKRHRHH